MNLEERITSAVEDLHRQTVVDPERGLANLHRTRRRRTVTGVAALATVLLASALAWAVAGGDDGLEPVPPVSRVTNGALVGLSEPFGIAILGDLELTANLPDDAADYSSLSFSNDGSELVYSNRDGDIVAMNVVTGQVRTLGTCPDAGYCPAGVSADTTRIAVSVDGGLALDLPDGNSTLSVPGPRVGTPVWSPDGTQLAFSSRAGLHVVEADGSNLRLLEPAADSRVLALAPSWSPDGGSLAYLAGSPVPGSPRGSINTAVDARYAVITVDLTTGEKRRLAVAGHCYCLGTPPPAVAWSPDGSLIAFAGTTGRRGVFTLPVQGGELTRVSAPPAYGSLAWQPLVD